jgi:hypothetical protein
MGPLEFSALRAALVTRLCGECPHEYCILRDRPVLAVEFCEVAEDRSAGWH